MRPLDLDEAAAGGVGAADDGIDEGAPEAARSAKSRWPRSSDAWPSASLRWRCGTSIEPFSWAMPPLLRVGRMS
ncbi:hypothetical protein [Roseomonas sp. HF4]|uniref:hypothetical protein n=1 Tax=Roseomonas sp. HF4 TaxID=2562313 RepID=UPI001484E7CB